MVQSMAPRARLQPMADADRRSLLDAARRAFAEHGFERASLNHVLSEAGWSKGAFYYHFDGKPDLFVAVVRDTLEPIVVAAPPPPPAPDAATFWSNLDAYLERTSRAFQESPEAAGVLRAAAALLNDPAWARVYAGMRRDLLEAARGVVEDGRRVGAVRDDLPVELLAAVVFAAVEQVDQWVLVRWDEPSGPDLDWWSRTGRDLIRRIARPGAEP